MKVWMVLYRHRHGNSLIDFWQDNPPTEQEAIKAIEADGDTFEPEQDEYLEVIGPFSPPK